MNPSNISAISFIIFCIASAVYANVNECLHPWNERINKPEQCKESADCKEVGASCVFSPLSNHYICCAPKKDAIQPECPQGMSLRSPDKNDEIILCDKSGSGSAEEQCPYNFECTESVTDFTKYIGQSNTVCCVKKN